MGRIIKIDSNKKDRDAWMKAIVICLRELSKHNNVNDDVKDLAAFIVLALENIYKTIDSSIAAWEKRGYWLKAEHFKMEWDWTNVLSIKLKDALINEDWVIVSQLSSNIMGKLNKIKVSQNHHLGTPWVGAWEVLKKK